MGTYIFGTLVIILGVFLIIKTQWFITNFGHSAWAEAKMGGGGTRLLYKIVGIIFIIGSLMYMTGMMEEVVVGAASRLFGIN